MKKHNRDFMPKPPHKKSAFAKWLPRVFRGAVGGAIAFTALPYATDPMAVKQWDVCAVDPPVPTTGADGQPVLFDYSTDLLGELDKLTPEKPFIMLGDTDHSDPALRSYLLSDELVDALAAADIRHIYLEMPPSMQPDIDALSEGRVAPKDFMQAYGSMSMWLNPDEEKVASEKLVMFILHAASHGIKLHAIDGQENISGVASLAAVSYLDSAIKTHNKLCQRPFNEAGEAFFTYFDATRLPLKIAGSIGMMQVYNARMDDTAAIPTILKTYNGEKSAIIYGAAHFAENTKGFYAHLKDKTASVTYIYANSTNAATKVLEGTDSNSVAKRMVPLESDYQIVHPDNTPPEGSIFIPLALNQ